MSSASEPCAIPARPPRALEIALGTHPHPARNAVATTSCRKPKGALRSAEASLCRAAPANPCQGVRVRIRYRRWSKFSHSR